MPEATRRVTLKSSGDKMIINAADFNPELHDSSDDKQDSHSNAGAGTAGAGTAGAGPTGVTTGTAGAPGTLGGASVSGASAGAPAAGANKV